MGNDGRGNYQWWLATVSAGHERTVYCDSGQCRYVLTADRRRLDRLVAADDESSSRNYNGCVLTINYASPGIPDGSVRILGYTPGSAIQGVNGTFIVMAVDGTPLRAPAIGLSSMAGRLRDRGFGYNGGEPTSE